MRSRSQSTSTFECSCIRLAACDSLHRRAQQHLLVHRPRDDACGGQAPGPALLRRGACVFRRIIASTDTRARAHGSPQPSSEKCTPSNTSVCWAASSADDISSTVVSARKVALRQHDATTQAMNTRLVQPSLATQLHATQGLEGNDAHSTHAIVQASHLPPTPPKSP